MSNNFSHQTNTGKTVNVVGDHTTIQVFDDPNTLTENIGPNIKRLFDSLKERYQSRYDSKLDGRFEIPLEVSENWNSDKPKIYKFDAEAKVSNAIDTVRKAFDEKGRLLIVGSPGSGKTVLLLKLALELLGDACKAGQKLPVIFNLASWSEDYEKFEDWLIDVLNSGNGLRKDFAGALLHEKQIICLLDGLDELARNEGAKIANDKRAKCLESLNDFLREGRKVVICCRREEFVEMQKATNQDAPVSAKVEVLDLTKDDLLLALQHAQNHNESNASATNLLKMIETNNVFLDVLSTPFYFITALEVFDNQLPVLKEENIPTDEEEIKKNLLMQFIDGKLDRQVTRNTHNFKSEKTKIWLKWLAKLMSEKKLTTFELSNLQPSDLLGIRLYKIVFCAALLVCLINWLSIFLLLSKKATRANLSGLFATNNRIKVTKWNRLIKVFSNTKTAVFISVLLGGFNLLVGRSESTGMLMVIGVCFGLVFDASSKKIETEDVAKWNLWGLINTKNWSRSIEFGASFGVYFCVLATLLAFIPSSIFTPFKLASLWRVGQYALVVGYVIGQLLNPFWFSLMIGLIVGFFGSLLESCHQIFPFRSLERPYQRFKGGFISNGIVLTVLNFPLSLLYIILLLTLSNFQFPPLIYLFLYIFIWVFIFAILISIPSFIITPLFRHLILRFCLYLEGSMPLQYATFLNYVAEARILEKDGGQWRFRHQILQDHFWKPSSPSW